MLRTSVSIPTGTIAISPSPASTTTTTRVPDVGELPKDLPDARRGEGGRGGGAKGKRPKPKGGEAAPAKAESPAKPVFRRLESDEMRQFDSLNTAGSGGAPQLARALSARSSGGSGREQRRLSQTVPDYHARSDARSSSLL
ncbi:hypothetical protein TeGR_g14411, partial [Tetraparma gracilis]